MAGHRLHYERKSYFVHGNQGRLQLTADNPSWGRHTEISQEFLNLILVAREFRILDAVQRHRG